MYLQNIIAYLKFNLSATNQHGVHSPFVYNYVTKCLYTTKKYSQKKTWNILLKSIDYFGAERVWLPPEAENIRKMIGREFPSVEFQNEPYDILFIDLKQAEKILNRVSKENNIPNDAVLLIHSIRGNAASTSLWEKIKCQRKVRVTVDLFHCAVVFFRNEQAEEHFKIRT